MLDHVSLSNDVLMQDKQLMRVCVQTCAQTCVNCFVVLRLVGYGCASRASFASDPLVTQHGQYTELRAAFVSCRKSTSHTRFGFLALLW